MNEEILCGSACVKYILKQYGKNTNIKPNMFWISELAISLKENGINNIKLFCYDSNLYNDFKMIDSSEFDGFKYLQKILDNKIVLQEKKLNSRLLKKELEDSDYILLCVDSKKFNKNEQMSGGHFIILKEIINDKIHVINPLKKKYEQKDIPINYIIKCCKEFGSWRILIKGETK
ncbi:MAG: hypothetical protein IKE75_00105 [Bacilli bacterium]|nr:hypothetical protein [Bacilli bacterium]